MKHPILFSVLTFCLFISSTAVKAGSSAHTSPFHTIHVAGNVEVIIGQGDHEEVEFLTDTYGTNVKFVDGIVKIKRLKLSNMNETVKVRITYKTLRAVKVSSGAQVTADNIIMAEHFDIDVSTGAEASFDVSLTTLTVTASEGAVIRLAGQTDSQNARAVTGGEIKAFDLLCNYTYARASTGGMVEVVANKRMEVKTSLGGEIDYRGNPEETDTRSIMDDDIEKQ